MRWVLYVVGGLCGMIGYIFASWTPLMGALALPEFVTRGIMLAMGIDPDEQDAEEEDMEEAGDGQTQAALAVGQPTEAGLGVAGGAVAMGASSRAAAALNSSDVGGDPENPENPENLDDASAKPKGHWFNRLFLGFRDTMMKFARFRPTGEQAGAGNIFVSFQKFATTWMEVAKKIFGVFQSLAGPIMKSFGFLSKISEFAEKNKLNVHLKIVIGYVQVLGSFASFNVEWPEGLTTLMNDMGSFMQFNVVELPKMACLWAGMSFDLNLVLTTTAPIGIAILFGLPLIWCQLKALCLGWTFERMEIFETLQDRFYNNVLFGAFLIYPIASLCSLQTFNCNSSLGVLNIDMRLQCPGMFNWMTLYSVLCCLIYPIGIPFLFWNLMKGMKIPEIAQDKKIKAGFYDMVALFNKMNATLECKRVAQIIGKIEDDKNEFTRRIEDIYRCASSSVSYVLLYYCQFLLLYNCQRNW